MNELDETQAVELAQPASGEMARERSAYHIADDLATWTETLEMLQCQLAEAADEDRAELSLQIAEASVQREHIAAELERKTDAFASVVRRMELEQTHLSAEETRLHDRRKAIEAAVDWLRNYMVVVIQQKREGKPIRTASNLLYLGSSDAVVTPEPSKIPPEYITAEVRMPLSLWLAIIGHRAYTEEAQAEAERLRARCEPSLSKIKTALKAGEEVPGADLKLNNHLVIR